MRKGTGRGKSKEVVWEQEKGVEKRGKEGLGESEQSKRWEK